MDASREVNALKPNEIGINKIISLLEQEEKEIQQKKYLVKILSLINTIEQMVQEGDFIKYNIQSIVVGQEFSSKLTKYLMYYKLKDGDGKELKTTLSSKHGEVVQKLKPEVDRIWRLNLTDVGSIYEDAIEIELKPGIKDNLIKALLSDELQASLSYSELQSDVSINETTQKRMKI